MPPGHLQLEVQRLTVSYSETTVLQNLTFEHQGPGLVQVLGPNGAGKSTLLKAIAGIIRPQQGKIRINGTDVTANPAKAGRFIGYLPQDAPEAYATLPLTAWDIVETEVLLRSKPWPRILAGKTVEDKVRELLNQVGLPNEAWRRRFDQLSGGERQRVLLARALVHDPPVLLLDEPLAPIDPVGRGSMARLIGGLSQERIVIVTSHDPGLLQEYTTRILLLNRTLYYYGNPSDILQLSILRTIYGDAVEAVGEHLHIVDPTCRGR